MDCNLILLTGSLNFLMMTINYHSTVYMILHLILSLLLFHRIFYNRDDHEVVTNPLIYLLLSHYISAPRSTNCMVVWCRKWTEGWRMKDDSGLPSGAPWEGLATTPFYNALNLHSSPTSSMIDNSLPYFHFNRKLLIVNLHAKKSIPCFDLTYIRYFNSYSFFCFLTLRCIPVKANTTPGPSHLMYFISQSNTHNKYLHTLNTFTPAQNTT